MKLGDVAKIINGKNQKAVEDSNGKYPICGSGGIMGYATDYLCPENSVIVGRKGNINRPIFMTQKFWNVDTAFGISANTECMVPKFLFYFCQIYDFQKLNKAVTIPSLVKSDLLKIELPVPSKETQLGIVKELDSINDSIAMLQQQVFDLDKLAQSIFYDLFGDPILNEKGWTTKIISEIATVKTGPFGSMLHKEDYISGGIPLVNPIHMRGYRICPDIDFTVTNEKAKELSNYLLETGDIVLARRGDIGRCAVVNNKEDGYLCGTGSLFVRFSESIESKFIMYVVKTKSFTDALIKSAKGATMLNLNSNVVGNLRLILPPFSLQQSFASQITDIENLKAIFDAQIAELKSLLAARMQYWFD